MTPAIGRRSRGATLPEIGKPDGRCPECGPHGNRGAVTLLWSVVPCIECSKRSEVAARVEAGRIAEALVAEIRAEGCEPLVDDRVVEINPLVGDHPWARHVRVVVSYRHAKLNIKNSCDTGTLQAALNRAFGVP